ncbi:formate dehydrogenase subunit gamma [Aureimonas fodinaquatilis]|uniref:Formate dehydrogenase subunit gamma n=1 Tax=Aureimonas fodinaquatilis TaxID=2565783 RepID=A0A5B0DXA9_9HYPH|nr:formate dehydrogenase subunit gamma [Aureimonas fodinaquatilis]KAA0970632.1 formate dehydrogenase subunit gamma [Aureimonas fodinaquatilis]
MLDHSRGGENFDDKRLAEIIAVHVARKGGLLPILHDVVQEFGYVDDAMVPAIAEGLNLSRADVHGVVTFYHDFRRQPAGGLIVRLCVAEACKAMGADDLAAYAEKRLGLPMHSTSGDAAVTLEPVYCLGLCSLSPSAMVNGRVYGRLTQEKLDRLLAEVAK